MIEYGDTYFRGDGFCRLCGIRFRTNFEFVKKNNKIFIESTLYCSVCRPDTEYLYNEMVFNKFE